MLNSLQYFFTYMVVNLIKVFEKTYYYREMFSSWCHYQIWNKKNRKIEINLPFSFTFLVVATTASLKVKDSDEVPDIFNFLKIFHKNAFFGYYGSILHKVFVK